MEISIYIFNEDVVLGEDDLSRKAGSKKKAGISTYFLKIESETGPKQMLKHLNLGRRSSVPKSDVSLCRVHFQPLDHTKILNVKKKKKKLTQCKGIGAHHLST